MTAAKFEPLIFLLDQRYSQPYLKLVEAPKYYLVRANARHGGR
jgi:hypothetical protein